MQNQRSGKKILSVLLAVSMLLGMATTALAADGPWNLGISSGTDTLNGVNVNTVWVDSGESEISSVADDTWAYLKSTLSGTPSVTGTYIVRTTYTEWNRQTPPQQVGDAKGASWFELEAGKSIASIGGRTSSHGGNIHGDSTDGAVALEYDPFVSVRGISDMPYKDQISPPGTEVTASVGAYNIPGKVYPSFATEQDIVWSLDDAGTTGATLIDTVLTTTATGTVKITATVANGKYELSGNDLVKVDYTETFDITITAGTPVKVIYHANGGTVGTVPLEETHSSGDTITIKANPGNLDSPNGDWVWSGWTTERHDWGDPLRTTLYKGGEQVVLPTDNEFHLYAYWIPDSGSGTRFTVRFVCNGGSLVGDMIVDKDNKINKPNDPIREGYDFGGWYKEQEFINEWDFDNDVVTEDTTLYAKWTRNGNPTYLLTIQAGTGGRITGGSSATYAAGQVINISASANTNYRFNGWTSTNGGTFAASTNAATIFTMPANETTITANFTYIRGNDTDSSDSDSSSGGSGTNYTTPTPSNTPADVTTTDAANAAKSAAAAAKMAGVNTATVNIKNPSSISLAALQSMAKTAGMPVKFQADSMNAGAVDVRITLDPSLATKALNLSASTTNARATGRKAFFEKWFTNPVSVVSLGQQGDFGQPVEIAAKIDPKLNTANLVFYSYNAKTNSYAQIPNPKYWIDKNGYVHFTTEQAGDIIISDGPLKKK